MKVKRQYVPPMAEQNRYAEDVILSSAMDVLTQDKTWGEWNDGGGEF